MGVLGELVKLQEVDSALLELEYLKGDLPGKVEEMSERINHLVASIQQSEMRLIEINLEIRKIQGVESDRKSKVEKLQDQLYLVKTNREYDALMAEIDHLKNEIDEEELRELQLSEEHDRLEEQLKLDKTQNKETAVELEKQKKELKKTIQSTEEEHKTLTAQRDKIAPNIGVRHIGLYDRVRKARNGVAVVPVTNHSCGGCHSYLTSQFVVEIRGGDGVTQCNSCQRILFWSGN